MRRIFSFINTLSIAFFVAFFSPLSAFADTLTLCPKSSGGGSDFSILCTKTGGGQAGTIIGFAIQVAFILAVIIALFYLIWGGIKWILSGGDKGAVETARGTIVAAVIGLIITFAAYFILSVVIRLFIPGFELNNISLPSLN